MNFGRRFWVWVPYHYLQDLKVSRKSGVDGCGTSLVNFNFIIDEQTIQANKEKSRCGSYLELLILASHLLLLLRILDSWDIHRITSSRYSTVRRSGLVLNTASLVHWSTHRHSNIRRLLESKTITYSSDIGRAVAKSSSQVTMPKWT